MNQESKKISGVTSSGRIVQNIREQINAATLKCDAYIPKVLEGARQGRGARFEAVPPRKRGPKVRQRGQHPGGGTRERNVERAGQGQGRLFGLSVYARFGSISSVRYRGRSGDRGRAHDTRFWGGT
ncbi:hypothetical protein EVAR_84749_1 [Eumeta japonica]|uniref:Uncharacterized protein n=1 Tax=Eumeta variegata TaxID=151549 RepID=A0A4C1VUA6_EUMVA|nr:hypothetical protein EVAR_84749_1 [Eumeta japonica]